MTLRIKIRLIFAFSIPNSLDNTSFDESELYAESAYECIASLADVVPVVNFYAPPAMPPTSVIFFLKAFDNYGADGAGNFEVNDRKILQILLQLASPSGQRTL